jgi:hypothetical protein
MYMSPLAGQEQMCGLLQAVQQDGAPGGAHEGELPLSARAQVRRLRQALPLLRVTQGASHRYDDAENLPRTSSSQLNDRGF